MQIAVAGELRKLRIASSCRLEMNVERGNLDITVNSIKVQDESYLREKYRDLLETTVTSQNLEVNPEMSDLLEL